MKTFCFQLLTQTYREKKSGTLCVCDLLGNNYNILFRAQDIHKPL